MGTIIKKYVLTEEGKVEKVRKWEDNCPFFSVENRPYSLCIKADVVKEADDIEDLCDAFVNVRIKGPDKGDFHCYKCLDFAKYAGDDSVTVIYAAILTETSIKFIAKLNEKGEWELL